jgi:hypothetical protein
MRFGTDTDEFINNHIKPRFLKCPTLQGIERRFAKFHAPPLG